MRRRWRKPREWLCRRVRWRTKDRQLWELGRARDPRDPLQIVMDLEMEVRPNSHQNHRDLMAPLERLMTILNDVKAPRPGGPPEA